MVQAAIEQDAIVDARRWQCEGSEQRAFFPTVGFGNSPRFAVAWIRPLK